MKPGPFVEVPRTEGSTKAPWRVYEASSKGPWRNLVGLYTMMLVIVLGQYYTV